MLLRQGPRSDRLAQRRHGPMKYHVERGRRYGQQRGHFFARALFDDPETDGRRVPRMNLGEPLL